jgi:hypothetical protein
MVRGILVFIILWLCIFSAYLAALRATPTSFWQVVKGGAVVSAITACVVGILALIVAVF